MTVDGLEKVIDVKIISGRGLYTVVTQLVRFGALCAHTLLSP